MKGYITKEQLSDSLKNELSGFSSQLKYNKNESIIIDKNNITDLQKYINDENIKNIKFVKDNYNINSSFLIRRNNLSIDFNNSTFNTNISETSSRNGFIYIQGKKSLEYPVSNINTEVTRDGYPYNIVQLNCNTNDINVNDFIFINIKSGDFLDNTKINPCIYKLVKVLEVGLDNIIVDYGTPFTFNDNYSEYIKLSFFKVEPVKNIVIKNLHINDVNNYDNGVHGILVDYCYDVEIDNITGNNLAHNLIMNRYSNNLRLNNIENINPRNISAGMGYTIQNGWCTKLIIENARGTNVRHIVDFTCCSHSILRNSTSYGLNNYWTTHSQYDHDIVFENVHGGGFGADHSLEQGLCNANILYKNCSGIMYGGVSLNTIVENCNFNIQAYIRSQITFINSNIKLFNVNFYGKRDYLRNLSSYCKLINTVIDLSNLPNPATLRMIGEEIEFTNVKLIDNREINNQNYLNIKTNNINITNSEIKNIIFSFDILDNDIIVNLNNNLFKYDYTTTSYLIYQSSANGSRRRVININNNNIITNKQTDRLYLFRSQSSYTDNIIYNIQGNYVYGCLECVNSIDSVVDFVKNNIVFTNKNNVNDKLQQDGNLFNLIN